jgi:hypothetical protein
MKADERAFRHDAKVKLDQAASHLGSFDELCDVDVTPAPIGNYFD